MADWLSFIGTKTITVAVLLERGFEKAAEAKVNDYVAALTKESLLKKIEALGVILKCSITTSNVRDYVYNPIRLGGIDSLRHELAHGRKKSYTIANAESDIVYLYRTAFHFLVLVVDRYNLRGAYRPKPKKTAAD
jgi:hypothetical protein